MSEESQSIKLIVADDHNMMLDGLVNSLNRFDDMDILATATNGREAIKAAHKHKPDVVVMDISMPDLNGIDATRKLTQELPGIKVMAISMHLDKRMVGDMLAVGAKGFVLKECKVKELAHGIRVVMGGESYVCSKMVQALVDHFIAGGQAMADGTLTPRERELLQLVTEGFNTKEISGKMSIATKTVETHRRRLMEKLEIRTVADLTKYAIREGITSLDY